MNLWGEWGQWGGGVRCVWEAGAEGREGGRVWALAESSGGQAQFTICGAAPTQAARTSPICAHTTIQPPSQQSSLALPSPQPPPPAPTQRFPARSLVLERHPEEHAGQGAEAELRGGEAQQRQHAVAAAVAAPRRRCRSPARICRRPAATPATAAAAAAPRLCLRLCDHRCKLPAQVHRQRRPAREGGIGEDSGRGHSDRRGAQGVHDRQQHCPLLPSPHCPALRLALSPPAPQPPPLPLTCRFPP